MPAPPHQLASSYVQLDRKLRFQSTPKTMIAVKHIRAQLTAVINSRMRGKEMTERQLAWWELALEVLGKEADKAETLEVMGTNKAAPAK
jgi:ATP-dependent RNA helicase DHX29